MRICNLLILLFFFVPISTFAAGEMGVTNEIVTFFRNESSLWEVALSNQVIYPLFITLTIISLAWKGGQLALKGADLPDFAMEIVFFIMYAGFWLWIIGNAFDFSSKIIDSFTKAAGLATGSSVSMTPGDIMATGLKIFDKILDETSWYEIGPALSAIIILLLFVYIAIIVLLVLIEAYIVAGAGVIALGFAGSPWTSDVAKKYLLFVLAIGLKMFFVFIVVGLGINFADRLVNSDFDDQNTIGAVLGVSAAIAYLSGKIPEMAQSMLSGASSGSSANDVRGIASIASRAAASAAMGAVGTAAAGYQSHKYATENANSTNPTIAAATKAGDSPQLNVASANPSKSIENNPNAIPSVINTGSRLNPKPQSEISANKKQSHEDNQDVDESSNSKSAEDNKSSAIQPSGTNESTGNNSRIEKGLSYLRSFSGAYMRGSKDAMVERLSEPKMKNSALDTAKKISENRISDKIKRES